MPPFPDNVRSKHSWMQRHTPLISAPRRMRREDRIAVRPRAAWAILQEPVSIIIILNYTCCHLLA